MALWKVQSLSKNGEFIVFSSSMIRRDAVARLRVDSCSAGENQSLEHPVYQSEEDEFLA